MNYHFLYTTSKWVKYGLSVEWPQASREHELVASYLERHPKAAADYRADQQGKLKYFDVLGLAEKEVRYRGKFLTEMTREELEDAVREMVTRYLDDAAKWFSISGGLR